MTGHPNDTHELLDRARDGNQPAFEELFKRHRGRLQKAIPMRIDRRLAARVDASDVLQETYLEAFRRLPKYLKQEEMPFYLSGFIGFAREKVLALHRRHLGAEKRAVTQEVPAIARGQFGDICELRNCRARAQPKPGTCKNRIGRALARGAGTARQRRTRPDPVASF